MSAKKLVLELLIKNNCVTSDQVAEILKQSGFSESSAYVYLYELKQQGFVRAEKFGPRRKIYCLDPEKKALILATLKRIKDVYGKTIM